MQIILPYILLSLKLDVAVRVSLSVCVSRAWIQHYFFSKASVYRLRGTREGDVRRLLVCVYLVPASHVDRAAKVDI